MPFTWSEDAAASLVREHQGAVAAFLRSLGCPPDVVEDLVQDTFLRILTASVEDRGAPAVRAWLRRVAGNLWIQRLRRDQSRGPMLDVDAVEQAWLRFERDDDGAGYLQALRDCLTLLDAGSREVLRLRYEHGLRRAEIARRRGASLGGVKSTLERAKERLRACIARRLGT